MKIAKGKQINDPGDPKRSLLQNRSQQNKQPDSHIQKDSLEDKKSANHDDNHYNNQMNDQAIDKIYPNLDEDDQFQIENNENKDNKMLLKKPTQQNKQPNNHIQKDSVDDKKSANCDDNQIYDQAINQDLNKDDQFQIENHENNDNKMLFTKPTQQREINSDSETMQKYSQVNKNNKTTNDHNDQRETHYDNRGFESEPEYYLSEEPPIDY